MWQILRHMNNINYNSAIFYENLNKVRNEISSSCIPLTVLKSSRGFSMLNHISLLSGFSFSFFPRDDRKEWS